MSSLFGFDKKYYKNFKYIAGVDEAGRGPLAGPVVASAVILPKNIHIKGINDSKTLTEAKRKEIFKLIQQKSVSIGIGICSHKTIDRINIFNATYLAMKKAVKKLKINPDLVLIDGPFTIPKLKNKQKPIIKGDTKSACVAAASIIAKVTRDNIMYKMHTSYPQYGFNVHKGYPTKAHKEAIKKYGLTKIHRLTFNFK
ncbi:MAG: ribonuclease HII [Elusimicrobia bacterium RIFOXYA2_FULL_39_19]|nr:MAG: ribonuclease HII [Elusimicrobia bacterium RIFOXYA2_FULL_39_19]